MLGAAQADALRAEPAGPGGVLGGVGVGAHRHPARAVGVAHQPVDGDDQVVAARRSRPLLEVAHDRRVDDRHLAEEDLAGGAVDRDDVALVDLDAAWRA